MVGTRGVTSSEIIGEGAAGRVAHGDDFRRVETEFGAVILHVTKSIANVVERSGVRVFVLGGIFRIGHSQAIVKADHGVSGAHQAIDFLMAIAAIAASTLKTTAVN